MTRRSARCRSRPAPPNSAATRGSCQARRKSAARVAGRASDVSAPGKQIVMPLRVESQRRQLGDAGVELFRVERAGRRHQRHHVALAQRRRTPQRLAHAKRAIWSATAWCASVASTSAERARRRRRRHEEPLLRPTLTGQRLLDARIWQLVAFNGANQGLDAWRPAGRDCRCRPARRRTRPRWRRHRRRAPASAPRWPSSPCRR